MADPSKPSVKPLVAAAAIPAAAIPAAAAAAVAAVAALPLELWDLIVSHIDKKTLKSLRSTNKLLHVVATPIVFRKVRFDLAEERTVRDLIRIASHDQLRHYVKTLVLHQRSGLQKFVGFCHWQRDIIFSNSIGRHQGPLGGEGGGRGGEGGGEKEDEEDDDDAMEENLMRSSEWNEWTVDAKNDLFTRYEAERCQMKVQIRRLMRHWYQQAVKQQNRARLEYEDATDVRAGVETEAGIRLEDFDMAIMALENIEEFVHVPMRNDLAWGRRWWRLLFISGGPRMDEDRDIESFQLAISLTALGKANKIRRKLCSLKLYMPGQAFWDADCLKWLCPERQDYDSKVGEDEQILNSSSPGQKGCRAYEERLLVAEHAFSYLTHLHCVLDTSRDLDESKPAILEGFLKLIERSNETLEHLTLTLSDPGLKYPTQVFAEKGSDNEFLNRLVVDCKPWKRLTRLELEVFTDVVTIMKFLMYVAPTLQELELRRVKISPTGETLLDLVTQISQNMHQLRVLELSESGLSPFIWSERITFDRKNKRVT